MFFEGYKFCEWTRKGSSRKIFSQMYISVFSSVCNLCHNRVSANVCKTNFVEVPKIHKICKICSSQKRRPMVVRALWSSKTHMTFSSTFGEAKAPSHMNKTNTAVIKVTAGTSSSARQFGKASLSFKRAGGIN